MDLNDVALFTRVVERGSFTQAARAAGLPKSSVTRSIARLERELGVRLIQRTTRQRGVTDAGRELYERVRTAVGALEEAADAVRDLGTEPRGVVRVTAPVDVAMVGLAEALVAFHAKHPGIHVELLLASRFVDLVAENIDLAIRAGHLADSSLVARRAGSTRMALFASHAYLEQRGTPRKVTDLASHDCVLFRGRGGKATWPLMCTRGKPRFVPIEVTGPVSADDMAFYVRAVTAGLGIGLLPVFLGIRERTLQRVLADHAFQGTPLHVVLPSSAFVPARVALVRDFLVGFLTDVIAGEAD